MFVNRRNAIAEYYGMDDEEVYGPRPLIRRCGYCDAVTSDEDLDAMEIGWWRIDAFGDCHDCRRGHLENWLRKRRADEKIA